MISKQQGKERNNMAEQHRTRNSRVCSSQNTNVRKRQSRDHTKANWYGRTPYTHTHTQNTYSHVKYHCRTLPSFRGSNVTDVNMTHKN